ncbi:MAG TPA: hypothetical protein VFV40_02885 [Nocardioides sp.]|nr:hypothetical protein [Nocardioides sp.]
MASRDDDDSGRRQVLFGLGALVVVTLLVGGIVSAVALGAARLSGLGGSSSAEGPVEVPSLYMPTGEPTTTPEAYPDPTRPDREEPSETPTEEEPTAKPARQSKKISLQAFPQEVSPGERITLTGVYPAGEGATLQVQRFEGSWTDFPVNVTVSGGLFNTYILTSRSGETRLRVTDKALNRSSNPVTVTIR